LQSTKFFFGWPLSVYQFSIY
jgi:hypothetical protein